MKNESNKRTTMRGKYLKEMKEVTKILSESNPLAVKLIKRLTPEQKKEIVPRWISNDAEVEKLKNKREAIKKWDEDTHILIFDEKGNAVDEYFFGLGERPFKRSKEAMDGYEFYAIKDDEVLQKKVKQKRRELYIYKPPERAEVEKLIARNLKKKFLAYLKKTLPEYISKNKSKIVNARADAESWGINFAFTDPDYNEKEFPYDEAMELVHKDIVRAIKGG